MPQGAGRFGKCPAAASALDFLWGFFYLARTFIKSESSSRMKLRQSRIVGLRRWSSWPRQCAMRQPSVPPGNRFPEQPAVPGGSAKRTQALKTTYEAKYRKVYKLLKNDKKLRSKIREAAEAYGIDPMHIVGAIVGEHTYNVDAYDRLQTYYVKAVSYLDSAIAFSYDGEDIDDFIQRPEFAACNDAKGSYDLWTCREAVWDRDFRGKNGRFLTTASAPPSSSPSTPARLSASASSIR